MRTAQLIAAQDEKYGPAILRGDIGWPPLLLFKRLVHTLSDPNPILHVATPNYDLLAEYAFEKAGLPYITGFSGGICRSCDWPRAERSMTYDDNIPSRSKVRRTTKFRKHIRLYKVHGSLNTFKLNNTIVENNVWIRAVPEGVERMMITPGSSKYNAR